VRKEVRKNHKHFLSFYFTYVNQIIQCLSSLLGKVAFKRNRADDARWFQNLRQRREGRRGLWGEEQPWQAQVVFHGFMSWCCRRRRTRHGQASV